MSALKYIGTHRPVVHLLLEAGHYLRSAPVARERLSQLIQWLEMQIEINTADLFSAEEST